MSDDTVAGADAEVFADFDRRKVLTRFNHPDTGEMLVELYLDPDTARDYAYNLSRAALALELEEG